MLIVAIAPPAVGDEVQSLIRELNDDRQRAGLTPLVEHPALAAVAQAHVADMAKRGYVGVQAPNGRGLGERLERAGYRPAVSAGMAISGQPSPWEVAGAVLDTRSLADLLRRPGEIQIGVGYHDGPFRLRNGKRTARAWSIIVAQGTPPPIADAVADLVLDINRARAKRGASPVRLNDKLSQAAAAQADDMIARGYFAHVSPDGGTLGDRVGAARYSYRKVGENLAAGQGSTAEAVQAWNDSPGHARTMYDRDYDEIGLAYRLGPLKNGANVVPHVWVAVFGVAR